MKTNLMLVCLFVCCFSNGTKAQVDPHFSQYYAYPMWLNPALAGTAEASYRVTAVYRNQWSNVTNAFSTVGVSADFQTEKSINFGVNVLQQTAGSGGYRYFNAQAAISYTGIRLGADGNHRIAFALQPGFIGRRFDESAFKGGDQWVPIIGYNPNIPTSDILTKTSSLVFDLGAGLSYYNTSQENKITVFGGISASHLTQPEDPFLVKGIKSKLPIRYAVHAGARIILSDIVYFIPNALYMKQGTASETMLGGYFQVAAGDEADVMLGAKYRIKDAISPFAGIVMNNQLMIGLSYDVTSSELSKMAKGSNAFELSVTLFGQKNNDNYYKCPRL